MEEREPEPSDDDEQSTPEPEEERPQGRFRLREHRLLVFSIIIVGVFAISATVFTVLLGLVADLTAVLQVASFKGVAAIALFSIGTATIIFQVRTGTARYIWARVPEPTTSTWINRVVPILCIVLSAVLALPPATEAAVRNAGVPGVFAGGPTTVIPGCAPVDADQVNAVYSHSRLASDEAPDTDVEVKPNGYIQQRFFAQSEFVSSIAVIISRPPVSDQPAFDRFNIGQVRLSLFEVDDNAKNIRPVPIKLAETDGDPRPEGVVQTAGENHKQTVFHLCPTKLTKDARYAFRVTNEEPGVVLAFSLNTKPGAKTSMDVIGTPGSRNDRTRINYHQVAGYVCSIANC